MDSLNLNSSTHLKNASFRRRSNLSTFELDNHRGSSVDKLLGVEAANYYKSPITIKLSSKVPTPRTMKRNLSNKARALDFLPNYQTQVPLLDPLNRTFGEKNWPKSRIPVKYLASPLPNRMTDTREKVDRLEDQVRYDHQQFMTYVEVENMIRATENKFSVSLAAQQRSIDNLHSTQQTTILDIANDNKIICNHQLLLDDIAAKLRNVDIKFDAVDKEINHFEQVTYDKLIKDTYYKIDEIRNQQNDHASKINVLQDDIVRLEKGLNDQFEDSHMLEVINRQIESKYIFLKEEVDANTREYWLRDKDIQSQIADHIDSKVKQQTTNQAIELEHAFKLEFNQFRDDKLNLQNQMIAVRDQIEGVNNAYKQEIQFLNKQTLDEAVNFIRQKHDLALDNIEVRLNEGTSIHNTLRGDLRNAESNITKIAQKLNFYLA